jgi:hypothetical protein
MTLTDVPDVTTVPTVAMMRTECHNLLSYFKHLPCLVLHKLTLWRPKVTTADIKCDAEKTKHPLKLSPRRQKLAAT